MLTSLFIYRRVNFHCNYQTFSSFVVLLTQQCYFHSDTRVLVLSSLKAIYADQELHTLKAQSLKLVLRISRNYSGSSSKSETARDNITSHDSDAREFFCCSISQFSLGVSIIGLKAKK